MDEIAKSNFETMVQIYKERKTNMDFVNFQEMLKLMKAFMYGLYVEERQVIEETLPLIELDNSLPMGRLGDGDSCENSL